MKLLRFEDLRDKRIVRTWTTLNNWIDTRGFPLGRMIGRFRTWTEAEVMAWIERQSQPSFHRAETPSASSSLAPGASRGARDGRAGTGR